MTNTRTDGKAERARSLATLRGRPGDLRMHCSFVRIHQTLWVTPATAAG